MLHIRSLSPVLAPALVLVTLGCRDDTTSPTVPESTPALATASSQPLAFRQVSAGAYHSCGVTADSRAYCWGEGAFGALGDGETSPLNRSRPVAVAGGLRFRSVSAGTSYACGLTIDRRAYCWGINADGELGDGTTTGRTSPVAVAGGRRFRQVSASYRHTCGVTTSHVTVCWGRNAGGELGDGTTTQHLRPARVAGGLKFSQVRAGGLHTCGLTTGDRVYCWGSNDFGQLGDGTTTTRLKPVAALGGLSFRQVTSGAASTCGVTTGARAYCWGRNQYGELGDGTTTPRLRPRAVVAGGLQFDNLTMGVFHTCGVTTDHRPYCWGWNFYGQLGDGTNTNRLTPVAVATGLRFGAVSSGVVGSHNCAVTASEVAYCWGRNSSGNLGDGTTIDRRTPVAVAAPM
jgi:alpha-tubulin suppressor-like RCC1 family protein